jgi:Rrf2 family transcriptional regulator, iron-sulfur cluster assembly transcription factor
VRLEVTRRSDLATKALVALAAAGRRMKSAELAADVGTTPGFVPQVVAPLVARGWIRSDPGPTGGYVLTGSLRGITVLDVIEAVEGPTDTGQCVLEDRACATGGQCALHLPWSRARGHMLRELARTTIADIRPDRGGTT